jgi:predicted nucleic acid-binding protein
MSLILDASATLAWLLPDEVTEEIKSLFNRVLSEGAFVPQLWHLEVANILTLSVRRAKITSTYRNAALEQLKQLAIVIDDETSQHAWSRTLTFADKYSLTLYDAAYLELAHRLELPLATLDEDFRHAAEKEKILLLGI